MPDMRKSQEPISVSPIPTPEQMTSVQPAATEQARLRNFCIIAHIDHGKSTLADRMLQATGVVQPRDMRAQYLDRMDIERERGITIKSQAVRMPWAIEGDDGVTRAYALNMIDTPGHVDFSYEVNRSLAACEGAVLLVDAAQGIQAQTLANLYMAIEGDLTIIPVLNKIDLPAAEPEKHAEEIASLIGCDVDDVLKVSGKTGQGVPELLDRIVETAPPPHGAPPAPARGGGRAPQGLPGDHRPLDPRRDTPASGRSGLGGHRLHQVHRQARLLPRQARRTTPGAGRRHAGLPQRAAGRGPVGRRRPDAGGPGQMGDPGRTHPGGH